LLIDLERIVEHRRAACRDYAAALANVPGLELPIADSGRPLYYFPVFVERKDELLETARRRRIELVAWPIKTVIYPIEDAALLPNYGYLPGSCPVAERVAGKLVGLPTDQVTTPRHRAAVVDLLERHHGVG
jgi:dTDP-4-amino-4,6-dideoxygalactose transaminase